MTATTLPVNGAIVRATLLDDLSDAYIRELYGKLADSLGAAACRAGQTIEGLFYRHPGFDFFEVIAPRGSFLFSIYDPIHVTTVITAAA
jgi:hypothetical protein